MPDQQTHLTRLYVSIGPTYIISRLLGLLPLQANRRQSQILLTSRHDLLYSSLFFAVYLSLSIYTIFAIQRDRTNYVVIPRGMILVISILILFLQIATVLMAYVMRKPLIKLVELVAEVDVGLEGFGIVLDHARVRRANWMVMAWLGGSVVFRSVFTLKNVRVDFLQQYTMFAASFIKSLLKYLFIIFVEALNSRFKRLNRKFALPRLRTAAYPGKFKRLTGLCFLHFKLCNVCEMLVHIYGLQMVLAMTVSIANMIFQLYFLYRTCSTGVCRQHWYMIGAPVVWILDESIEIALLVKWCVETAKNANQTPILLHEIRNEFHTDPEISRQVHTLSMQFLHQKIQFTALGFFPIDYTLIFSMITTVVSMLTFLINYDMTVNQLN